MTARPSSDARFDLVTFGEGLLRLSPCRYERLEQSGLFDAHVIGPGLETAVMASRLGWQCAWLSAVGDTPLGRRVVNKAREHGVDVSGVCWIPDGRTGLCFMEPGSAPRPTRYFYDTAHTAFQSALPDLLPWPAPGQSRWAHFAITPLEAAAPCLPIVEAGLAAVRETGCGISISVDEPAGLTFSPERIPRILGLLKQARTLIVTLHAAETVMGLSGTLEETATALKARYANDLVAVVDDGQATPRAGIWRGAALSDRMYQDREYALDVIDAGGAFNAFAAAFLYGCRTEGPEMGLRYGNAAAGLTCSIPGHLSWLTLQDIRTQAQGMGVKLQR